MDWLPKTPQVKEAYFQPSEHLIHFVVEANDHGEVFSLFRPFEDISTNRIMPALTKAEVMATRQPMAAQQQARG